MAYQQNPTITTNPAFPASIFQQAPPPKPKTYSGFTTKKEEVLYDQVTGSLLRLLSMRLALTFSIGAETATVLKRMRREDEKLQ